MRRTEHEESVSQKNWSLSKSTSANRSDRIFWEVRWRDWIDGKQHHSRWNVNILITCWSSGKPLPRMKKAKLSKKLSHVNTFFDINGIVMTELVPENQIVNQTYYLNVLVTVRERDWKKILRCGKTNLGSCIKTTHCHSRHPSAQTRAMLACDLYFLSTLKETWFESMEKAKRLVINVGAPKCFDRWRKRIERCIVKGRELWLLLLP